jgi:hypothetical protein
LESFESVLAFGKRAQELPHLDDAMLNAGVFKFEWKHHQLASNPTFKSIILDSTVVTLFASSTTEDGSEPKSAITSHVHVIRGAQVDFFQRTESTKYPGSFKP